MKVSKSKVLKSKKSKNDFSRFTSSEMGEINRVAKSSSKNLRRIGSFPYYRFKETK